VNEETPHTQTHETSQPSAEPASSAKLKFSTGMNTSENDETICQQSSTSESDTNTLTITDLESSSATIMQDSHENSDENENDVEINPAFDENSEQAQADSDGYRDEKIGHSSSPTELSPSSRALSSVSVISEEKSESFYSRSPTDNSGPSSPNQHATDSQTLVPIKQPTSSHPHHHNKSPSSTPERGHSRSNSNSTSSSIDQQQHIQSQAFRPYIPLPNHAYHSGGRIITNFPLSSASSSDIEVVPLDSLESSMLYATATRRPSTAEVEIQTDAEIGTTAPSKMSNLLAEKELEIAQLREEGEKLSKKQFDLTTVIKKLRTKEKETDGIIKGLKNEIDTKSIEIERVTKTFLQKESIEQKQVQTISKLNNEKAKLEDMISELRSKMEDSTENCASMKASLEEASM
jgi:cell division protein FtsB